jgi:hypothetical protein
MSRTGCKWLIQNLMHIQPFGFSNWALVKKTKVLRMDKTNVTYELGCCHTYAYLEISQLQIVYGIDHVIYMPNQLVAFVKGIHVVITPKHNLYDIIVFGNAYDGPIVKPNVELGKLSETVVEMIGS